MEQDVRRGEIYYADLDPVLGSEQGGVRPVLVIQNNTGNRFGPTVIVAPISRRVKKTNLPTHVVIPSDSGLPAPSIALMEQIRTIDKRRLQSYIGSVCIELVEKIDCAIRVSLGTSEKKSSPAQDEMELCLCPVCASQFYNSPVHVIQRTNPLQASKDCCTYCQVRDGYDFRIQFKRKGLGDDLV